jgi:hypothetical protein
VPNIMRETNMASSTAQPIVKVVGTNGQISLGKPYAGRPVLVEETGARGCQLLQVLLNIWVFHFNQSFNQRTWPGQSAASVSESSRSSA